MTAGRATKDTRMTEDTTVSTTHVARAPLLSVLCRFCVLDAIIN
jgi:hypothetical protein